MKKNGTGRVKVWVEAGFSTLTGVMAVVTIFSPDWIEGLTGWDPDHHNGSFEVLIVVALAMVSLVLAWMSRRSWRALETDPVT